MGNAVRADDPGPAAENAVESTTGAGAVGPGSRCCRRLSPYAGASIRTLAPFPVAARRTGRAELPHPALGQGLTLSPTEGRESAQSVVPAPTFRTGTGPGTAVFPCCLACVFVATTDEASIGCVYPPPDRLC